MSYENFVQCQLTLPLSATATDITMLAAVAPYQLPPATGGVLVIADSPNRPSQVEIIRYTARAGLQLTGVARGQEGTTARDWAGVAFCYQALTAGDLQAQLDSKQSEVAPGTALQFWRGDKTWRDFFTDVRAATLTGLSTGAGVVITAADTVLSAFGKIQSQLNSKAPLASPALTGVPSTPTAATGTNTTQVSSTAFVQQELATRQPLHAKLTSLSAAVLAANQVLIATGTNSVGTLTTGAKGRDLIALNTTAEAQSALDLVPMVSPFDLTANRVVRVGDFGLGAPINLNNQSIDNQLPTGFYYCNNVTGGPQPYGWLLHQSISTTYLTQTFTGQNEGKKYTRSMIAGVWTVWRENLVVTSFGLGAQPSEIPSTTNLNGATSVGFYKFVAGATGAPVAGVGGSLITHSLGGNYIQQIVMTVTGSTSKPNMYYRHFDSVGNPGPWVSVINSATAVGAVSFNGESNGAVIETGTNANGTYVRYADGTQIIRGVSRMPTGGISSQLSVVPMFPALMYNNAYDVVWSPITCVGTGAQQDIGHLFANGVYIAKYTDGIMFACYTYKFPQGAPVDFSWVATGRWRA